MPVQARSKKNGEKSIPFLVKFFATGFFSGYFPVAPGTFGSFIGVLLYLLPFSGNLTLYFSLIIIIFILGVFTSDIIERKIGKDPSIVVIDEIVGMWISLFFIPKVWYFILAAFLLFRIFDIIKVFPANYFDRKKGGLNIMMDDVVAGIYANLILQIFIILYNNS